MSFSNTLAFAVARAVDVATASVFTKETDCTISTLCDVALERNGEQFLQRLGRLLNRIQPGSPATATTPAIPCHTRAARISDYTKGQAIVAFLSPMPR